jgi:LemA protein
MIQDYFGYILIGIIVLVIIGLLIWAVSIYNRFFSLKNGGEATLGQIKVAMKKRLDMIEQLLGAVKSYAAFEKETLTQITKLRTEVSSASPGDLNKVEQESKSIFGRLIAIAENYPDLKTNTTVLELTGAVKSVEDEIGRQRYTYNNIAQEFNTMRETIPSNFIGNFIGMKKMDYLEFEEAIENHPKIEF